MNQGNEVEKWVVDLYGEIDDNGNCSILVGSPGETICKVFADDEQELESRAQLIASAPQMLALIKECADYLEPKGDARQINTISTTSKLHFKMQLLLNTLNNKP